MIKVKGKKRIKRFSLTQHQISANLQEKKFLYFIRLFGSRKENNFKKKILSKYRKRRKRNKCWQPRSMIAHCHHVYDGSHHQTEVAIASYTLPTYTRTTAVKQRCPSCCCVYDGSIYNGNLILTSIICEYDGS